MLLLLLLLLLLFLLLQLLLLTFSHELTAMFYSPFVIGRRASKILQRDNTPQENKATYNLVWYLGPDAV